jgi:hypothetical protein
MGLSAIAVLIPHLPVSEAPKNGLLARLLATLCMRPLVRRYAWAAQFRTQSLLLTTTSQGKKERGYWRQTHSKARKDKQEHVLTQRALSDPKISVRQESKLELSAT